MAVTPSFSVTLTIGEDDFAVPFTNENSARYYADQAPSFFPEAKNIVVNDLVA